MSVRGRRSGGDDGKEVDEPVSPTGRFFLQPEMDQVINCILGFDNPLDAPSIKTEVQRTLLKLHPRLSCLLVRDEKGREHWRPAPAIDIDKHVFFVSNDCGETFVNDYVAELTVSSPLPMDKPLWEIHLLPRHRCVILRLHHTLGDGIALMSLFLASCERADDPSMPVTVPGDRRGSEAKPSPTTAFTLVALLWRAVKAAFFTSIFVIDVLLRLAWVKDTVNSIAGGAGVELWPRKLCTVTFDLDDIKAIKTRINGTINDVLVGVITSGLAKYLKMTSSKESRKNIQITGLSMVNTRATPGLQDFRRKIEEGTIVWGNRIGFVQLPFWLRKDVCDPFDYVLQAKTILSQKKQSLEAHLSYKAGAILMAIFGPKVPTLLNYRIICRTSFTVSNVVGPSEMVMFAKNPITYIRVTSSSLPHAVTMHIVSYNGKAEMQILVAKDIIHDSEVLVKCFEDAVNEMKLSSISCT